MEKKIVTPKAPTKGKELPKTTNKSTKVVAKTDKKNIDIIEDTPKQTNESTILSMASSLFDRFKPKETPTAESILNPIPHDIPNIISDVNNDDQEIVSIQESKPIINNNNHNKWLEQEIDALSLRVSELETELIDKNQYIQSLEYQLANNVTQPQFNNPNNLKINGSFDDVKEKLELFYIELKTENARFIATTGMDANINVPYIMRKLEDNFYFLIS